MSKGLFGSIFDFNGDGDLDAFEQAAEFMFFSELTEDDEDMDADDDDDIGIDPDDYDTEDEYLDAVQEKDLWISTIPDDIISLAEEFCVMPEDYDTYEEFLDALDDEIL